MSLDYTKYSHDIKNKLPYLFMRDYIHIYKDKFVKVEEIGDNIKLLVKNNGLVKEYNKSKEDFLYYFFTKVEYSKDFNILYNNFKKMYE